MTKEIPLSKGLVALVDDDDFEWLVANGPWHAASLDGRVYAVHTEFEAPRTFRALRMHKLLIPGVRYVDHINRNSLDNRRCNLRAATASQNAQNRRRRADSKWPYKGIRGISDSRPNPWLASITLAGKTTHLGTFPTAELAARAYDAAAIENFGEFAAINFPQENAS